MTNVPVYDLPQSPILIVGFFWNTIHTRIIILCESEHTLKVHLIVTEGSKTDLLHSVEQHSGMPIKSVSTDLILTEDEYLLLSRQL